MSTFTSLAEGVVNGDANLVETEVRKAINSGVAAQDILAKGLIEGMNIVAKRFGAGEMFLPEVLLSSSILHKGLDIIRPLLTEEGLTAMTRVVIGTVEGDIHDIGKKIVCFLLEGNGCEVIDIGVNVNAETFSQAIQKHKPHILGMSALLTTTMPNMEKTIKFLKEKGLRQKVKVIVGGAPISDPFARSIGADGFAPDAGSAVELVKRLRLD